ncbi:hypothetical protein, partial [Novosphingobium beihaiensis]
ISSTLARMLSERETEKANIEARLAHATPSRPAAQVFPHLELVRQFAQKVSALRETLSDEAVRTEASELMDNLIESVTIYPDAANGPEAEVIANVADLAAWALNDNAALKGGRVSSSSGCGGRI